MAERRVMHMLRFIGGREASASRYPTEAKAVVAARRIARRDRCYVEVWWLNDAGVPKVLVRTVTAAPARGAR